MNNKDHHFLEKHRDELTDFALVELLREQISRKMERRKRGNDGWIDHSFANEHGTALYKSIVPLLNNDWFWNDFCASVISDMCHFEFWNYPSVNLINTDETKNVNVQSKVFTGDYKVFAQINLMEHTSNVVKACETFFGRPRPTTYIKKQIAVAALLHDVGKHYTMMTAYKIIQDHMLPRDFKHQEFSSQYFNKKIVSLFEKDMDAKTSEIDEVSDMIFEHHGVGGNGGYQREGSADLREIDRIARMYEYKGVKSGNRGRHAR